MIRRTTFLLFSLLWCAGYALVPDTMGLPQRVAERLLPCSTAFTAVYHNPANMVGRWHSALSEATVQYSRGEADRAVVAGMGRGYGGAEVDLSTYLRLAATTNVWGTAAYTNGTRREVLGSETSDYATIYPYVMADTIGGDMKSETYSFEAGYATAHGSWRWGIDIGYRALSEYRDVDPRPRNISHRLGMTLGAGRVAGNYVVGAALTGARYRQSSSITFYNELGGHKVYHLTGLGTSYYRFDGSRYQAEYALWSYGASLQLMPLAEGVRASASIDRSSMAKSLPSNADITINRLSATAVKAEVAYTASTWGAGIYGGVERRTGSENLFGVSSGDIYEYISRADQWHLRAYTIGVRGYATLHAGALRLSACPDVGLCAWRESYELPAMHRSISRASAQLALKALWVGGANVLNVTATAGARIKLDSSLRASNAASPYFGALLQSDYRMLAGNAFGASLSVAWTRAITPRYAFEVGASATYGHLPDRTAATRFAIGVGLVI